MMQAHNDERRARLIDLSIAIQQIPAPTGDEGRRAAWVAEEFRRLGYACEVDALHKNREVRKSIEKDKIDRIKKKKKIK